VNKPPKSIMGMMNKGASDVAAVSFSKMEESKYPNEEAAKAHITCMR